MNQKFTSLLHFFLKPLCPRAGLAYILRRHPLGPYFPLAALKDGQPLPVKNLHLLPFTPGSPVSDSMIFDHSVSLATLAARGRLEVMHFEPPVHQTVWNARDSMLLVISWPKTEQYSLWNDMRIEAAAEGAFQIVDLWSDIAATPVSWNPSLSLEEILDRFCDTIADEPFFQLTAELRAFERSVSRNIVNPLTWNAYLAMQAPATSGQYFAGEGLSPWHRLRAALTLVTDQPMHLWTRDDGPEAPPVFVGFHPGAEVPLLPNGSVHRDYAFGSFDAANVAIAGQVQARLAQLERPLGEQLRSLNPEGAARIAWDAVASAADTMMDPRQRLHDVYERTDWPYKLPAMYEEVRRLVSAGMVSILQPFGGPAAFPLPSSAPPPESSTALHLLWCLRKRYVHPAMLAWAVGRDPESFPAGIRSFLCAEDVDMPQWSLEMLRRFHDLQRSAGLRDLALRFQSGAITIRCDFSVREPDKWTAALLYGDAPADGKPHALRRAFTFFRRHAQSVAITRLEAHGGQWAGSAEIVFTSGEIQ